MTNFQRRGTRAIVLAGSVLAASIPFAAHANSCVQMAASVDTAVKALVSTATDDANGLAGMVSCAYQQLPKRDFGKAIALASKQITDPNTAQLLLQLAANQRLAENRDDSNGSHIADTLPMPNSSPN